MWIQIYKNINNNKKKGVYPKLAAKVEIHFIEMICTSVYVAGRAISPHFLSGGQPFYQTENEGMFPTEPLMAVTCGMNFNSSPMYPKLKLGHRNTKCNTRKRKTLPWTGDASALRGLTAPLCPGNRKRFHLPNPWFPDWWLFPMLWQWTVPLLPLV